jgi:hypothetical protein
LTQAVPGTNSAATTAKSTAATSSDDDKSWERASCRRSLLLELQGLNTEGGVAIRLERIVMSECNLSPTRCHTYDKRQFRKYLSTQPWSAEI